MPEPKEKSLTAILNTVIPIGFYRGCLVKKLIGGYEIFGQKVSTEKEVDEKINESLKHLQLSIKNKV